MPNKWIVSDHHFDHANMLTFTLDDGTKMRPFASVQEMQDVMIENHNALVKPQDKVYFLGDFVMNAKNISMASWFNGHKRIILGNHDPWKRRLQVGWEGEIRTSDWCEYFEEVYSSKLLDNLLLTHIPVHPDSLRVEWTNVHGHTHNNQPQGALGTKYYNVCVEMTDYKPVELSDLKGRIAKAKQDNQDRVMQHLLSMGVSGVDLEELEKL